MAANLYNKNSYSTGTESVYTQQSISDLTALGANLTAYTDTLESLKDYSPDKYNTAYQDTKNTKVSVWGQKTENIYRQFAEDTYTDSAIEDLKADLLPDMISRLTSIRSKQDQPGRSQVLGNTSLLG